MSAKYKLARKTLQFRQNSSMAANPQPSINIFKNLASAINAQADAERKSNVHEFLGNIINEAVIPLCEMGPILSLRRQIQDDPVLVKALALRLKQFKKIYNHFCVKKQFTFKKSALSLFEMRSEQIESGVVDSSHFWYPLTPEELWPPFVHCMMTVLDEIHANRKYDHIELVEFYEWIARIAFRYTELKKADLRITKQQSFDVYKHEQICHFLDTLIERVYANTGKNKLEL